MLNDIVFIEALYFKGIFWEKLSYATKLSKKCHVLRLFMEYFYTSGQLEVLKV